MTDVEKVPLAKTGAVLMKAVEDTVGDIDEPGPGEEQQKRRGGKRKVEGVSETPCPEGGDGGSIE